MALQLKYASNATLLLDDLVRSLGTPSTPAGLVVPVLMPSLPLVERAKVTLARRCGVSMGASFLLPGAFIEHIAKLVGVDPIHPSWRPEGLSWRLVPLLAAMVREGYSRHFEAVCVDSRAQMALARELADRFDQYLYFRPQMIAAWTRNECADGLPDTAREDEGWQKELWRRLASGLDNYPDPAVRLSDLARRVADGSRDLPATLEVLATGPLPPTLLPLLRALAGRTHVCLRTLLPSTEYLGDIRAGRSQMRAGEVVDPAWEGNPLLSHLGKQAIESFKSFDVELVDSGQEYEVIPLPESPATTLLQQIQVDVRAAQQPANLEHTELNLDNDRSIRVHRCHGARREVEIVRDELLNAFTELPNLRASEILVLAPDLDTYGPLAEAICREGDPALPLRLTERRIDRSDHLVKTLKAMLQFAAGRTPLSEGIALLELPAIGARIELLGAKPETLARDLRAAGITWGLNGVHRQAMDAGDLTTGTWRASLDRLLAGLWFGGADDICDVDGHPVLPVAGDLDDAEEAVGAVLNWVDGLIRLFEEWQDDASPHQWAVRLDHALDEIVASDDGRFDPTIAADLIDQLRIAEQEHGCTEPISVGAVGDWLERLVNDEVRSMARVGGGIAMGGFKPLRAIPCRVLVLMGMHDSAFPRKSRSPAWDLLAAAPQPSDRDPLRDDRQLFLDAVLAAEDRVIVTATARNIRSNKEEPLSACVDSFLRVATRTSSNRVDEQEPCKQLLLVDHRLQPFHQSYFAGKDASFDYRYADVARLFQQNREKERPFASAGGGVDSTPIRSDLELDRLIRDFKDPWSRWLETLEVVLPRDGEDPQALDREPMEAPSGLIRWQILREVIDATLANHGSYLEERLAADRRLPYGQLGRTMGKQVIKLGHSMAKLARQEASGSLVPHHLVYRHTAPWISGTVYVNEKRTVHVVIIPGDLKERPHYRLETWIRATFASAAGLDIETVVVSRRDKATRIDRMRPIGKAVARTSLDTLLQLWHQMRQRPVPFKPATSAAIFKEGEGGAVHEKAMQAWNTQYNDLPGDGDGPAAQLVWRGQDPFVGATLDEWQELAKVVFERVEDWVKGAEKDRAGVVHD